MVLSGVFGMDVGDKFKFSSEEHGGFVLDDI
jgi:hypothetical protein